MDGTDFEGEGLLDGLTGRARDARLALLKDLEESGVPLEELKRAVESDPAPGPLLGPA